MQIRIFLVLLLLCFWNGLFSQDIDFKNYTIKDGLSQNTINYIFQDSKGYMWFGTQLGASRFDGKEFQNFKMSEGLINNYVHTIFEDSHNNLWFGTRGGASIFTNGKFINYTTEDGLIDNHV